MASVDVVHKSLKAYNTTRVEVLKGETIDLILTPDKEGPTRWFWEHDPVVDSVVSDNLARVVAKEAGDTTVYIYQGEGRGAIIMELNIKVVDVVTLPAAKLVSTVGESVPKRAEATTLSAKTTPAK